MGAFDCRLVPTRQSFTGRIAGEKTANYEKQKIDKICRIVYYFAGFVDFIYARWRSYSGSGGKRA